MDFPPWFQLLQINLLLTHTFWGCSRKALINALLPLCTALLVQRKSCPKFFDKYSWMIFNHFLYTSFHNIDNGDNFWCVFLYLCLVLIIPSMNKLFILFSLHTWMLLGRKLSIWYWIPKSFRNISQIIKSNDFICVNGFKEILRMAFALCSESIEIIINLRLFLELDFSQSDLCWSVTWCIILKKRKFEQIFISVIEISAHTSHPLSNLDYSK
jgi:hypothetical protein